MGDAQVLQNGLVVQGDVDCNGYVVIYIIKADKTSYINYIKPLILARALGIPHIISIILTTSETYRSIHPERYVPALKDQDPTTGQSLNVFESTACLQYLAERYDVEGLWAGRSAWEKAQVLSWTAFQTAGLGPTAKYWLYFSKGYPNRKSPEVLPKTIAKLHANTLTQWGYLNTRLSLPNQLFVALPDRASIADLSYFPFAMPWMFEFLGTDIGKWPAIKRWSERMMEIEAIQYVLRKGPTYGHVDDDHEASATQAPIK